MINRYVNSWLGIVMNRRQETKGRRRNRSTTRARPGPEAPHAASPSSTSSWPSQVGSRGKVIPVHTYWKRVSTLSKPSTRAFRSPWQPLVACDVARLPSCKLRRGKVTIRWLPWLLAGTGSYTTVPGSDAAGMPRPIICRTSSSSNTSYSSTEFHIPRRNC
jgi:hypothetical protein